MPLPPHVSRGAAFEKRFLEWLNQDRQGSEAETRSLFPADVVAQHSVVKVDARHRSHLYEVALDEHGKPVLDEHGQPTKRLLRDTFTGRAGRIDALLTIRDANETIKVIFELKASDLDGMKAHNVRRNVARHAAQLYAYQGHLAHEMWDEHRQQWQPANDVDAFQLLLVYERRPTTPGLAEEIELQLGQDAIQTVWFDEIAPGR